jgi:hypothetical protein
MCLEAEQIDVTTLLLPMASELKCELRAAFGNQRIKYD